MKYRDLILVFLSIIFFLSLGYSVGVDLNYWFLPVFVFIILVITIYKLWIEK